MSQVAVNRTAMYHISHHIYLRLKFLRSGCQLFGDVFEDIPQKSVLEKMQQSAFSALLSDPDGFVSRITRPKTASSRSPILYLDPLYVLFGDLHTKDTVFVLDLSTVTTPDWHGPSISRAYSLAFDQICTRQPNVVAISQNTADTLYANYGFPLERTSVLPLYVPQHFIEDLVEEKFPSPEPYILFVGSLETRKNIIGALESFRLSRLGEQGYRCLIAGGNGRGSEEINQAIRATENAFVTGYVTDRELRALYRGASAFIYPSYLEGFGVPLLEAMYFGVPAVASITGACPEVGGSLMRYFDPDDHVGFAQELVRLVQLDSSQRAAYATAARERIENGFSVSRFDAGLRAAVHFTDQ